MKKTFVKIIALALVAVFACVTLASCALGAPNADPEKAEKSLEKKGYDVKLIDDEYTLGFTSLTTGIKDLECVLTAENDDEEAVEIYYFEDEEAAEEAWEKIEKLAEKAQEENEDLICKMAGKMIYMGTKAAIRAAR